jgi:hypothetical protein
MMIIIMALSQFYGCSANYLDGIGHLLKQLLAIREVLLEF